MGRSLDWSPDGKTLAFENGDGRVGLLDLGTGKVTYTSRGYARGLVAERPLACRHP